QSRSFDPNTTLYSVFFGINDYSASVKDGDHMLEAAEALLGQIKTLSQAPTNARYFLVIDDYGRGTHTASGLAFKTRVFNGLSAIHESNARFGFAYVGELSTFKTIVSFGDAFTSNGKSDGSAPDPPVQTGTNPKYGGRFANGYVWVENLANDMGAHLLDYAVPGAVTDTAIWPGKANESSFVKQVSVFKNQSRIFEPKTTLYSVFL
ncbi:hypothetical protein FRC09_003050, partial [Ceratobasidium sp. 395]